jgi:hypothetical protein
MSAAVAGTPVALEWIARRLGRARRVSMPVDLTATQASFAEAA